MGYIALDKGLLQWATLDKGLKQWVALDKGLGVEAFEAGINCFESSSLNNLKLAISMMELPRSDSRSGREVASRLTGSILWRKSNLVKSWL